MDLRHYFGKRTRGHESDSSYCSSSSEDESVDMPETTQKQPLQKKETFRSRKEKFVQEATKLQERMGKKYLWLHCSNPTEGMFCTLCKKCGVSHLQVQEEDGQLEVLLTGIMPQS